MLKTWLPFLQGAALVLGASGAAAKPYPGPLGLTWGLSPPEVKSMLNGKLNFVDEKPADEAHYDTIDQKYRGPFAGMKTLDIYLRFYKGQFFYMAVALDTVDESAAKAFERVVTKMTQEYGKPSGQQEPIKLSSNKAYLDKIPLDNRGWALPLLRNEQKKKKDQNLTDAYKLKDIMARMGLWDPFAGWKFDNDVTVQSFIYLYRPDIAEKDTPPALRPMWIFAKLDLFKKYKKAVGMSKLIEPRDF